MQSASAVALGRVRVSAACGRLLRRPLSVLRAASAGSLCAPPAALPAPSSSAAQLPRAGRCVFRASALGAFAPGVALVGRRALSSKKVEFELDGVTPKNVVRHPYTTGGMRYMPGFSFPAPRSLESIIKYALLERETPEKIRTVWNDFHDARIDCVASTWSRAEYETILERKKRCPRFVYPVLKGDGKFFTLVAEWQDRFCIFTFLDDYRRNPSGAEPYLSVALFDDFLARKQLVLVRGDFSGHLLKRDAAHVLNLMRYFYLTEPRWVETFNKDPAAFKFDELLRECPPPPPPGSKAAGRVDRDDSGKVADSAGVGLSDKLII